MNQSETPALETDPRFPSGPWTGFFLQRSVPGRHRMELHLTFRQGSLTGQGRDWVGPFVVGGSYSTEDGKCHWTKHYHGQHNVRYRGFNEGKGIWGTWQIATSDRGGFHIWPEGIHDAAEERLYEEADMPLEVEEREVLPLSVGGDRSS
jgi:hypothetical protein